MHTTTFSRPSLAILLLLVTEVLADDDDTDFLMNVFSDLGPVLALFGEQFARQFLSETFTWYDHLIFVCVPLGIMTAIAGAIRVEGRPVLKAFIGRARENRAAAEIDYMSSTSAEVGELFNGKGIVRTMGQSEIAQFIVLPGAFNSNRRKFRKTLGIHTLKSATEEGKAVIRKEEYRDDLDARFIKWFKSFKVRSDFRDQEIEVGGHNKSTAGNYWESLQYPNLQLNIAAKRITAERRSIELHLAATTAIILQLSLLVIAVVIPYQVSGFEKQPWGLPCYVGGSVLLFIGMLSCSVAIERSTKEYKWYSNDSQTTKEHMNLFWVQRKQRVSDQEFGSYIIYAQDKEFVSTSSRKEDAGSKTLEEDDHTKTSNQEKSSLNTNGSAVQDTKGLKKKADEKLPWNHDIRAVTALLAGGAGFTVQFIGLRGLPWPVAVAHLGAIVIMAIIRALIRRRLGEDTQYHDAPSGYELDFLAIRLVETKCCTLASLKGNLKSLQEVLSWRVDTAKHGKGTIHLFNFPGAVGPNVSPPKQISHDVLSHAREAQYRETINRDGLTREAHKVMSVRKRLGDLCEWETRAFKPALALVRSVEGFLDEFVPDGLSGEDQITWKIPLKNSTDKSGTVGLKIAKTSKGWKINTGEIEAILSLWMSNMEANMTQAKTDKDTEW
ncbi:unnamed protein product [Fusarium langsethiae]|nr:unnamed protein product [Fusarium langsethiae]